MRIFLAALVALTALTLAACQEKHAGADKDSQSVANAPAPPPAPPVPKVDPNKKLNDYVEAYNTLIGTVGLTERADYYVKSRISKSPVNGSFNVDAGVIGQGVEQLATAHGEAGDLGDLDPAAAALSASAGKAQQHLASLAFYFTSKKYYEDKLARGRAEDPAMLAELDAALGDLERFHAALERALEQRDQKELDDLKAKGEMARYDARSAMMHAKRLVNIAATWAVRGGEGIDALRARPNPKMLTPDAKAKADAEASLMEQAISDGMTQKDGQKFSSIFSQLTRTLGIYRSIRQNNDVSDVPSLVDYYNSAVQDMNSLAQSERLGH